MKKSLNILTMIYGFLLLISGILKLMGGLDTMSFHIAGKYLTINNSTSMFYIITVNFLGGFSFFYHALMTINFQNIRLNHINNPDKNLLRSEIEYAKPLSNFVIITGLYCYIISFLFFIKLFGLLGSFERNIITYWELFVLAIIIYVPYAIIPGILVFKNIALSREAEKKQR